MRLCVPIPIKPRFQRYAWGDPDFIPQHFGIANPEGVPYAETWFGAHPALPSIAVTADGETDLDRLIACRTNQILGQGTADRFGELPYMAKILAAARPLSIQVHPSRPQALVGFERENDAGTPLDAPNRCYRDANHKPELLVALTDFHVLCDFRPLGEIAEVLDRFTEIRDVLPGYEPSSRGLRRLVEAYFRLQEDRRAGALRRMIDRLRQESRRAVFGPENPEYWALIADREFSRSESPDPGVLFVFLLNLFHLGPGDAVFLPAGTVHSYLRGAGVEVMANSDNVVRCGLTPKHIEVPELLAIANFDGGHISRVPTMEEGGELVYRTPAEEFQLGRLRLRPEDSVFETVSQGADMLIVLDGDDRATVTIRSDGDELAMERGSAGIVPHGLRYSLRTTAPVTVFRVTVPRRPPEKERQDARDETPKFRGREPVRLSFGTSGLRGLVSDLTDLEAYVNTRGFLLYLTETTDVRRPGPVAVAGDLRPSTESPERSILRAVVRGIQDSGFEAVYFGRIPTPALIYGALQRRWPSVMVTGSHIPFDRNGIKFSKVTGEVLKSDESGILEAVDRLRRIEYARSPEASIFDDDGMFRPGVGAALPEPIDTVGEAYVRRYLDFFTEEALAGMRIIVYEHSAVGREILVRVLGALGARVHPMGRTEGFVAIDTEAISDERLVELQRIADEGNRRFGTIDAIVSTDGDSDRPLIAGVDAEGRVRFFSGDLVGIIVADYLDADSTVVPVSASDAIDMYFRPRDVPTVRTRIGSPWVIAEMLNQPGRRSVGWEANGGFLVGSEIEQDGRRLAALPTRDAMLPIVAVLNRAARDECSLVQVFKQLPQRFTKGGLLDAFPSETSRELLRSFLPDDPAVRRAVFRGSDVYWKDAEGNELEAATPLAGHLRWIRQELSRYFVPGGGFGKIGGIDFLDGVRVSFDNGDIAHIRPSGNAPQLRIYAVADTQARAEAIVALVLAEPDGTFRKMEGAVLRAASEQTPPPSV